MRKYLFIFVSIFLFISCDDEDDSFNPIDINFSEIGKESLSGNGQENISQSNLIIQNQVDWDNLMTKMDLINEVTSTFNETQIDFDNYTIIAIFLEVKPNGWEIEIDSIIENENDLTVSTQETEYFTLAMTQPFYIAKINKTDKSILFE